MKKGAAGSPSHGLGRRECKEKVEDTKMENKVDYLSILSATFKRKNLGGFRTQVMGEKCFVDDLRTHPQKNGEKLDSGDAAIRGGGTSTQGRLVHGVKEKTMGSSVLGQQTCLRFGRDIQQDK